MGRALVFVRPVKAMNFLSIEIGLRQISFHLCHCRIGRRTLLQQGKLRGLRVLIQYKQLGAKWWFR
jgi:hypothetical protein